MRHRQQSPSSSRRTTDGIQKRGTLSNYGQKSLMSLDDRDLLSKSADFEEDNEVQSIFSKVREATAKKSLLDIIESQKFEAGLITRDSGDTYFEVPESGSTISAPKDSFQAFKFEPENLTDSQLSDMLEMMMFEQAKRQVAKISLDGSSTSGGTLFREDLTSEDHNNPRCIVGSTTDSTNPTPDVFKYRALPNLANGCSTPTESRTSTPAEVASSPTGSNLKKKDNNNCSHKPKKSSSSSSLSSLTDSGRRSNNLNVSVTSSPPPLKQHPQGAAPNRRRPRSFSGDLTYLKYRDAASGLGAPTSPLMKPSNLAIKLSQQQRPLHPSETHSHAAITDTSTWSFKRSKINASDDEAELATVGVTGFTPLPAQPICDVYAASPRRRSGATQQTDKLFESKAQSQLQRRSSASSLVAGGAATQRRGTTSYNNSSPSPAARRSIPVLPRFSNITKSNGSRVKPTTKRRAAVTTSFNANRSPISIPALDLPPSAFSVTESTPLGLAYTNCYGTSSLIISPGTAFGDVSVVSSLASLGSNRSCHVAPLPFDTARPCATTASMESCLPYGLAESAVSFSSLVLSAHDTV